jgi:hypothetical protein
MSLCYRLLYHSYARKSHRPLGYPEGKGGHGSRICDDVSHSIVGGYSFKRSKSGRMFAVC